MIAAPIPPRGTRRTLARAVALVTLALVPALVVSLVADRLLGVFGFPAPWVPPVAHPPHFRERVSNIEYAYTFETNALGLRYRDIPVARTPGTKRIVLLGDSFVEGEGVELRDTFGMVMEEMRRRDGQPVEFINAGLSGTGPVDYGRILFDVGFRYEPDGVLMLVYANDVTNTEPDATINAPDPSRTPVVRAALAQLWPHAYALLARARFYRRLRAAGRPEDFIKAVGAEAARRGIDARRIDRWKRTLDTALVTAVNRGAFNGALLSPGLLDTSYWTDALDVDTPTAKQRWMAMSRAMHEIVRRARERDSPIAVAFAPAAFQYDSAYAWCHLETPCAFPGVTMRRAWSTETTRVERLLRAWADAERVPFLDLTPAFRREPAPGQLYFTLDGHWTPAGHRLAAREIDRWLEESRAFPE